MKKIILASKNAGKIQEFKQMLANYPVEVLSLLDLDYEDDIAETATTFVGNAQIKAKTIAADNPGVFVVADDSGLEIDALNGEPGVYSARYAKNDASDDENIDKVLDLMRAVEEKKRSARFVCVLVLIDDAGVQHVVRGTCAGQILAERRGDGGFGYDPIFYLPQFGKSMAQLDKDAKNAISHRGMAFGELMKILGSVL